MASIEASYFDGRSARGQPVRLHVDAGQLCTDGELSQRWPLAQISWPERTRHGRRSIALAHGGELQFADAAAFDAWRAQLGVHDSLVVRLQQSWRATLLVTLVLAAVALAGYLWGVPWAARALVSLTPLSVDQAVGEAAMQQINARWLKPTALPVERQAQLRQAFDVAVARAYPSAAPPYTLHFAAAVEAIGANAFALPGGSIVVTDAMVALLQGQDDALIGVLGHELGHVRQRHGMRSLVQVGMLSAATALALGDFSTVLAGVPALIGQMAYSRDAEREADADAAQLLRASGRTPAAMLVFFERLATTASARLALPIALASHPVDEERKRFFRDAAANRASPN